MLQEKLIELEKTNMAAFKRNGDAFDTYFRRWDLMVHTAMSGAGELLAFAISGMEGRAKVRRWSSMCTRTIQRRASTSTLASRRAARRAMGSHSSCAGSADPRRHARGTLYVACRHGVMSVCMHVLSITGACA